jgi:hypothetical protein
MSLPRALVQLLAHVWMKAVLFSRKQLSSVHTCRSAVGCLSLRTLVHRACQ